MGLSKGKNLRNIFHFFSHLLASTYFPLSLQLTASPTTLNHGDILALTLFLYLWTTSLNRLPYQTFEPTADFEPSFTMSPISTSISSLLATLSPSPTQTTSPTNILHHRKAKHHSPSKTLLIFPSTLHNIPSPSLLNSIHLKTFVTPLFVLHLRCELNYSGQTHKTHHFSKHPFQQPLSRPRTAPAIHPFPLIHVGEAKHNIHCASQLISVTTTNNSSLTLTRKSTTP